MEIPKLVQIDESLIVHSPYKILCDIVSHNQGEVNYIIIDTKSIAKDVMESLKVDKM